MRTRQGRQRLGTIEDQRVPQAPQVVDAVEPAGLDELKFSFGEQMAVDPLDAGDIGKIASYLAKYVVKSAGNTGALDHRLREGEIGHIDLPEHLLMTVATAWRLGGEPDFGRLRRWAHALGYTGHLLTKSQRFSTTFGQLRAVRSQWRSERDGEHPPVAALPWSFEGMGFKCAIDAALASCYVQVRAEERQAAGSERYCRDGTL
ncbi:MAG: replication initiator [Acidimicrobiales bacterium]